MQSHCYFQPSIPNPQPFSKISKSNFLLQSNPVNSRAVSELMKTTKCVLLFVLCSVINYAHMQRQKFFLPLQTVSGFIWVLYYMLLGIDSLQFCPTAPALPARRVSHNLTLLCEVRRPRQRCSIMKRFERRVLGWAPGNPLAHFWSCQQYYY